MGNAQAGGATLQDPGKGACDVNDNILHFEHSFKARLVDSVSMEVPASPREVDLVDARLGDGAMVRITLVADKIQVEEDQVSISRVKPAPILLTSFANVSDLVFDHSHSAVKVVLAGSQSSAEKSPKRSSLSLAGVATNQTYIFVLPNSLELEQEVKARLDVLLRASRGTGKHVTFQYIGMFAGPTKPKPFQRKRANLSKLKSGTLPTLKTMKDLALKGYQGASAPVQTAQSRRLDLALQHIHEGFVSFRVLRSTNQTYTDFSSIRVDYSGMEYYVDTNVPSASLTIPFKSLAEWRVLDSLPLESDDNGLTIKTTEGASYFFQVRYASDVKHVIEFFWNSYLLEEGHDPEPGSTHGRIVEELFTVSGSISRPPVPVGSLKITDSSGRLVMDLTADGHKRQPSLQPPDSAHKRHGSTGATTSPGRRLSGAGSPHPGARRGSFSKAIAVERPHVRAYWSRVVLHQGWLTKRGGMKKTWVKRYFVLYRTCMGHVLCYYSDHTETALYSDSGKERNVIDCCKVELLRPVSNSPDAPPLSFDIQSIERDWTVCAGAHDELQTWLKVLAHAVDADVGIMPDDEASFCVKPRKDVTGKLIVDEYSTLLRVHAWGVTVDTVDGDTRQRAFFWPYTDLYKWSVLSHNGKIALQLQVFSNADYTKKAEFVFRTREAHKIASTIEYHIEKFMAVMALRLEGLADAPSGSGVPTPASGRQPTPEPPKSPLFRKPQDLSWEEEDGDNGDNDGDWASEGGDDDRQADFLDLNNDDFFTPGPNSMGDFGSIGSPSLSSSPFDAAALSPCATPAPVVQYTQKGISTAAKAKMEAWSSALAASCQGVLYEDDVLQVMLRMQFTAHNGTVSVMYTNTGSAPIDDIVTSATSTTSGVLLQATPLQTKSLAPGEQTTQTIRVVCMEAFSTAPSVLLEFTTFESPVLATRHTCPLPLPINVLHFIAPVPMDRATFLTQWQNIQVPEVMDTFASGKPIDIDTVASTVSGSFQTALVHDLCQRTDAMSVLTMACCLETGTMSPSGKCVRVGALLRLEISTRAQAFRLTVRAQHPTCAQALYLALKHQLLAL